MIGFKHTSSERDLWRGWLSNGQSVELSRDRFGWSFGAGVHIHGNDDTASRMLFLRFWRYTAVIPIGFVANTWGYDDAPQWSVYASSEFGLWVRWRFFSKTFDWPWSRHVISYDQQLDDGSWVSVWFELGGERVAPYSERHPYKYVLKNGDVQNRIATISKRRHVMCYRIFKALGWPKWADESIEVAFDGEVGERSGSWKGGTIGCGYDLRKGETMLQCLRRMENEREF